MCNQLVHRFDMPEALRGSVHGISDDDPPPPYRDTPASHAIVPVHKHVEHHLSLFHLECVRRHLRLGIQSHACLVPELSSHDTSVHGTKGTCYQWYSEIYFADCRFLQRQGVEYLNFQDPDPTTTVEEFVACPHHRLKIHAPEFGWTGNILYAQAPVVNDPPRCKAHPRGVKWNSLRGRHVQMVVCQICHCDAECIVELKVDALRVRYTCYRDLGTGNGVLPDPKWMALLTGSGDLSRDTESFDLYSRVWRTARHLDRLNLEEYTHTSPKGVVFNVLRNGRSG
jgi:hypothetical protein